MSNTRSVRDLERRMRPGPNSAEGFLGPKESLDGVLAQDRRVMASLGISTRQLADALEDILGLVQDHRGYLMFVDFGEYRKRDGLPRKSAEAQPSAKTEPATRDSAAASGSTSDKLPAKGLGYMVNDHLQVFVQPDRGLSCPWGCSKRSDYDFVIVNRRTGEAVSGPSLILHLIRAHHFFGGLESPYRIDPTMLARVLGLAGVAVPPPGKKVRQAV